MSVDIGIRRIKTVVWAASALPLIRLVAAVASRLSSLIDVSPFPFDIPLSGC